MTLRDAFVIGLLMSAQIAFIAWIVMDTHKNLKRKYTQHTDADVDKFMKDNSALMDDLSK